jgi:hypothetical protein
MERVYTTPLIDKLGVRPGARVVVAGVNDAEFRRLLDERTGDVTVISPGDPLPAAVDLVFLGVDSVAELARLGGLRETLVPSGAIWVVSRKGKATTIRDVDVIDAGRAAGLVDNKVASFSATHTALRLVIPRALRPG